MSIYNLMSIADTRFSSTETTTNRGTEDYLIIGYRASDSGTRRSHVKADFSSLAGKTILSAKFYLYGYNMIGTTSGTWSMYRSKRDWVETEATWTRWKVGYNWSTAGGYSTTDSETAAVEGAISSVAFAAAEGVGWKEFTLDLTKFTEMTNGTFTNNGFIFKTNSESGDNWNYFYSREKAGYEPYFLVEFVDNLTPLWFM